MRPTATEENGNLTLNLTDGTVFTIYPVKSSIGLEIQTLLVGISLGTTAQEHGSDKVIADTDRLTKLALGIKPGAKPGKRWKEFDNLRSANAVLVSQCAILWNTGGGSIDAVRDLIEEGGSYPKALGRVMESSGLGAQFKLLQTWLNGGDQEQN